uniref:Uncharacterized protein n=1 Tax=Chromera velia CCMP2878 TaxID=1169474 RepID=A0A0G4GKC6_9ALVE|eukprot:Cvel_22289.t1-p1 / transcript=Cvel_22289.t1 / gene=Cvel_22289 / organism=Chromera_velia_CCMP2878 / gene_product=hypothetical protein / transcript_product=hypothetical protein / location=Cvel_scaffold2176:29813-31487(-) / protein_length=133 / sequence_SO=supercontig / SO=protein_coding / is_pseudo=false
MSSERVLRESPRPTDWTNKVGHHRRASPPPSPRHSPLLSTPLWHCLRNCKGTCSRAQAPGGRAGGRAAFSLRSSAALSQIKVLKTGPQDQVGDRLELVQQSALEGLKGYADVTVPTSGEFVFLLEAGGAKERT